MFVSFKKYGAIAQLGEHLPCKQGAEGSSPSSSTLRFRLALRSWVTEERNDRLPIWTDKVLADDDNIRFLAGPLPAIW